MLTAEERKQFLGVQAGQLKTLTNGKAHSKSKVGQRIKAQCLFIAKK